MLRGCSIVVDIGAIDRPVTGRAEVIDTGGGPYEVKGGASGAIAVIGGKREFASAGGGGSTSLLIGVGTPCSTAYRFFTSW
eukprot:3642636-Amphidinium_carterae.1